MTIEKRRPAAAHLAVRLICTGALALIPGCAWTGVRPHEPPTAPRIEVVVDQRIELLGILARLGGAGEYGTNVVPRYAADIDRWFAPFRDHPAVVGLHALREKGITHDALMSLAIHLAPMPALDARIPLEGSELDSRWNAEDARAMVPLIRSFSVATHADQFFDQHRAFYDSTTARMRQLLGAELDEGWFARFFGPIPAKSRFILTIAANNGQFAYGPHYRAPDGAEELYAIVNVHQVDSAGLPVFIPPEVPTIVHEFSHSFVNPTVARHFEALRAGGDSMLAATAAQMQRSYYTTAKTVISEALVRASVARYVRDHLGPDSASRELDRQKLLGFVWSDDLYALLGAYGHSRSATPTLDAFMPTIIAFFADAATSARATVSQFNRVLDARRPRVLGTSFTNGGGNVSPTTTELSFTFDRRMERGYFLGLSGIDARAHFPGDGKSTPSWDSTRTVFRMPVLLKPNWDYEFSLNAARGQAFFSDDGVPLAPYSVRFHTGNR